LMRLLPKRAGPVRPTIMHNAAAASMRLPVAGAPFAVLPSPVDFPRLVPVAVVEGYQHGGGLIDGAGGCAGNVGEARADSRRRPLEFVPARPVAVRAR